MDQVSEMDKNADKIFNMNSIFDNFNYKLDYQIRHDNMDQKSDMDNLISNFFLHLDLNT